MNEEDLCWDCIWFERSGDFCELKKLETDEKIMWYDSAPGDYNVVKECMYYEYEGSFQIYGESFTNYTLLKYLEWCKEENG